jgi:hypothetical protein
MISGHGKFRPLSTDPVSIILAQGKSEMDTVRKLQEVIARQPAKRTGIQFQPPSDVKRRLVTILNEAKKKFGVVVTDPARQLKSALDARMKYYNNRIKDLAFEIKRRQKIVRERGAAPTSPELEAKIVEYRKLKAERDEILGGVTPEQRLKLAIKAMERSETEFRRRREAGEFTVESEPKPWQDTPEFKAAKARRDAEKAAFEEMRGLDEAFQRESELKQFQAEQESLLKTIAAKQKRLAEGPPAKSAEMNRPAREEVEKLKQQSEELSRKIKQVEHPPRSAEARALSAYKSRLASQVAELEARRAYLESRIKSGEITLEDVTRKPRVPLDISKDVGAMALKARAVASRQAILKAEHEARLKLQTVPQKIWRGFKLTRGALVNLKSSFDFSAPRQALAAILSNLTRAITHPFNGIPMLGRPFQKSFASWWSEGNAARIEQALKHRPNALSGAYKTAGLEFTELTSEKFTRYEENAHSILDEWAAQPFRTGSTLKTVAGAPRKALSRGVRMSNRAFIAFLNSTRAELFDHLVSENFRDRPPTDLELKAVGNLVNIATGRGKLNPKTAQVASEVLWAPKLLASRVQFLAGQPFYHGTARTRGIVAKEYARVILGGALLAYVASMFDDHPEGDEPSMTSTDFGKIKRGDVRVDIWGGFQQPIVLGSRFATGSTEGLNGKTRDIGGGHTYSGLFLTAANFGRSKLRPDVGMLVDLATRGDFVGHPNTPASVAANLLIPMPLNDVAAILRERGLPEGLILELLNQFGAGVSYYGEDYDFAPSR